MAEKRLSAQEVLERRKMAKEAGTYNGASSSSESRNVQEVLERRNRAKEAGTYKAYEPKKVQSVAPSITNEQAKALTNQKTTGSAIRKYKEQQQDRYGTSDSRFEGLTNPTYQNYLDNIQIHATEQKHFGWLKEQASNLESMKRYPEIAEAVKAYHTARWNPLEYMQKYDAENVLKKYGYDEEGIKSLVDTYNRERNALASAAMKERADELTDSGLLGKAVAKLEGFGANMASIFAVPQEWANTLNEKITGEYNPLDTNSAFQALGEYRDRIEQNITEDIKGTGNGGATLREALNKDEEETPAHRQALGDVYQAASSVANNLATAAAFGQAGALAVMGAQAAQSSMNDTFKRTGDNTKSSLTGTAAGLIEAGTEYLPMDNLWDMIKGTGKTLTRSTLANWIVQSGIEGAEEMTSEALNTLVDRWINSQDSNYELNVRNYMNQGYDEEKARDLAFGDFTGQVWEAGKVGALAGGIGGGIAVGANKLAQYGTGADALETTGKMEQVVAQAENYEDTRVKKALKSYQEKPSSMNAGKLIYEMYAVDEIARNKAEKKDKGKLLRKNTKNRKEGQISQAQNALEETKSQNTEHKPQIDVENAVIRMSEAQNAEELSDVMHEVEDNGTEEQIQEARSYYEMRGAQMVVEGKTTNEELAFTGMQMSEAKAYEAGSKNEAVAPEKLSLKGKIAYNEGQQSYVKELARKNIISNTEDVIGAKVTDNAGKELVIQDIILEGREPSVRTSNGTANLKDISFQNEAVGLLYNNASTLGSTKAAQAYIKNYPGNIMVNAYESMVQSIMKDGELGLNIDKVLKRRAGATYWIKEEGVREFYALGKEKAKDSNRQLETVKRKGKGQLKDKRRGKTEEPLMKVLEQIAERTGLDIEVSDKEVSEVRGYFEESLSRIVLNADANMFETVFHELGEFTDSWNTKGMQKFQTALLDWYFETHDNEKMQNLIESVQNVYKQQEGSKTYREAANEIVNDAISGLFAAETGTKDFAEWLGKNRTETETKTILQTIADFLKDLCDAIRTYISEHNLSGTTRTAMEMSEERAKELRKQFLDAMDKAVENYQKAETSKASKSEGTHFSLVGVDENGIEVYETSEETKKLSYAERKAKLLDLMKHEYAGRTAKFVKGGKVYYAQYNTAGLNKGVHGDRKSEHKGYNAKINIGADGNYIELAENALYKGSSIEQGKNSKFHSDAKQWDYYVKTIQSDGVYFNVLINVKDAGKEQYVYDITLKEATHQRALKHLRLGEAASNSRIPQNQKNATKRFSLAGIDEEYLAAVDNGDMETAQRMVDDAAKKAGYTIKAYHGTTNQEGKSVWNEKTKTYDTEYKPFTVFKKQYSEQAGHFFNSDVDNAGGYGSKLYSVYLRLNNPLVIDCKGQNYASISYQGKEMDTYEWAEHAKKMKYDGVIFKNISDGVGYDDLSKTTTDYVAFESNQVKSSDVVTYDDGGETIPLSKRFGYMVDIRYSLDINQYLDENEQGLFWNKIGERKNGTQFPKSRNGDSILTIGNKLVYTGRGYQNPKVNKIVEVIVTEDSEYETTYTSFIQEDIINDYEGNEIYKNTSLEEYTGSRADYYTNAIGRQVVIETFNGQDFKANGKNGLAGKGQVRQRAYYNFADEQNGSGDTGKSRGSTSLRYSLNDATDLSDFWFNNDNLEEPIGNAASILEEGAKFLQGKEVDITTIRRIARGMVKEYQSHYDVDTLTENLEKLFSYMQSQDKVSYDDMIRIMTEVTMPVIEESTSIDETQQEIYKTFKKNLRNMSIKLSAQQKQEVAHYYDSYENFRRKMFGTLNLSESGQELDSLWFEISQMSNGFVDWDVTEADQPLRLVEVLEEMKPQVVNNFGADNHGVAMDMALRIYEEYFKAQHSAKVRSLKLKMKQERKDLRREYEDGLLKIKNSELQRKYNQEAAEYRFKIKKTANELIGWIEKPTNQKHVPKELKGMVLEFLDCIDFVSHRAKEDSKSTLQWKAKMQNISKKLFEERTEMEKEKGGGPLRNFIETLNPDFIPTLDKFLEESGEAQKISQMDKEQLKRVAFLIRTMKTAVQKANELHANTMYRYAADAGTKTLRELETRKKRSGQTKLGHDIGKTLSLDMAEPKTYFERLGKGATSIYKEIRKGMDKRIFLIREARQYMEEILKDIPAEELKTWVGDKATVHTVQAKEGEIQLTTGQIMSLYLLSKRAQGLRHILLGGIKPAQIGEGKEAIIQHDKARVTPEQLQAILELLTPEQKAFADKLQKFLSENCADWGNEVTMQLYEYERFLEKGYFPIKTVEDQHGDKGKPNDKQSVYAIKNFGFTKSISKDAPQAIWIEDVLDVFTDHVTRMASYNAYLIPLSDAMKWFNFNESGFVGEDFESESVHGMIEKMYGQEANEYFKELLYEINGRTQKSKLETADMLIRNFKKGSVMAKFSVAIQQPTAYVRALNVLDAKDMLSALDSITSIKKLNENADEAIQYSAIAQWKDWGFFESHISKSMKQVITGQQTKWEELEDYASWGAQTADKLTWGVLWNACKKEIARTKKDLEVGSKEFFEAVTERFDEVIDETQVVDSILHKSPILKATDKWLNMEMAFQNENLKSYNTFYRAANHMAREEANGFKKIQKAFINKKFGRAVTIHLFSVLFNSMFAAFAYAFRDDKEEAFGQRYAKRLRDKILEGINPFSFFPLVKDIISLLQGYDVERVDVQAISDIINAGKNIYKRITKPDTSRYTWYALAKKTTNAICTLTGAPFYNVWNDAEGFFEQLAGMNIPESESNGDLYEELIWSEEGSNAYERAYKKLQKQKGKSDKDIKKGVRSKLNTMFKEGELTEEEAEDALKRFGYTDVSEIVKTWKENMEK